MDEMSSRGPGVGEAVRGPATAFEFWLRLWLQPALLGAAAFQSALHGARPVPRAGHGPDPHAQLIVPEPLEADGEHGLLA